MTWLQRYRLRRFVRSSLWLPPVLAMVLALTAANLFRWFDRETGWTWLNLPPDGARTILGAFTSSMLTFIVFVVSSLLIVVQLASAQLTPRVIAMVFADRRLKWILSAFTFDYTYTLAAAGRIGGTTPQLTVALAIVCNLLCIALLFWFAQWLGGSLRPIAMLQAVADDGRAVVESVYPERFDDAEEKSGWTAAPENEASTVAHVGTAGVVLAFDQDELLTIAAQADVVIELVPQVGDFVARGDPLFRVRNGGRPVEADALRARIAIGPERTMEQDPRFAFRIMVDIANKALSPAINDPTTAVLALDQIHRLLMYVGRRRLDTGQTRDPQGRLRLCYRTPDWIDFVSLGVTEIRQYGATSVQVARRLHILLEHLLGVLPPPRQEALRHELSLLERATRRTYPDEEDRNRAVVGDLQGIGSSESE
jgi:uncharacterized membrane protein